MLRLREASHDTAGAVLPPPSYKTLAIERVAGRPGFAGPGAACQCGTSRPRPGLRPPPARHTRCSLIHQSQRKRPEMLQEPLPGRTQNTRSGAARTTCRPTGTCRQIGGSRAGTAASNCHAARLAFQSASAPIAEYVCKMISASWNAGACRSSSSGSVAVPKNASCGRSRSFGAVQEWSAEPLSSRRARDSLRLPDPRSSGSLTTAAAAISGRHWCWVFCHTPSS